jgi:hypothetical protein
LVCRRIQQIVKNMPKKIYLNSKAAGIDQICTHQAYPRGIGRTF